ncbi:MAG: phytoene desaturase family protein [Eggerthella lenta]
MKRVIVIGAGVAGLAAAARLQHAGYEVTLFEKEPLVGGKMNQIREEGFTFDVGPTIVMMPELYREVFETCGRNADDYIPMEKVEPLMDISFGPGDRLRLSNDLASMTAAVEAVGEKDAQGYFEYLALLYKRYLIAKDNFLQRSFRKPIDFYNPKSLVAGLRLHTLGDAYSSVAHHVKDDRLRKALAFQTLYIGISPFEGPSLYMIIPMIELLYGVWFMKGGMYAMAQAMGRLFLEQGGELRTSTPVERIVVENGCACGVEAGGTVHYADYVVCDADFPYAITQLVDEADARGKYTPQKIEEMEYSCSCFILYLGLDKRYPSDAVHSIRFASDFERNIDDIFDDARFPTTRRFTATRLRRWTARLRPRAVRRRSCWCRCRRCRPHRPADGRGSGRVPRPGARPHGARDGYEDVRDHIVFERAYTPLDFAERSTLRRRDVRLRPTLLRATTGALTTRRPTATACTSAAAASIRARACLSCCSALSWRQRMRDDRL